MNKELHFAIIGCGRIAQRHAQHIHNIGKLVAVCDIVETKAIDLAKQYNANPYSSIDGLLQENTAIDVVAICAGSDCTNSEFKYFSTVEAKVSDEYSS